MRAAILHVIIYADIWTKYKDKQTITDCSVFRCLVLRVHRAAQHCHCSKTESLIILKLWMSNYLHCQMPRHLNWNVVSGDANQARAFNIQHLQSISHKASDPHHGSTQALLLLELCFDSAEIVQYDVYGRIAVIVIEENIKKHCHLRLITNVIGTIKRLKLGFIYWKLICK